jgi:hypothetical protein
MVWCSKAHPNIICIRGSTLHELAGKVDLHG